MVLVKCREISMTIRAVHSTLASFWKVACDRTSRKRDCRKTHSCRPNQRSQHQTSRLVCLDPLANTGWIMDRVTFLVRTANRTTFRFDLSEFMKSAHFAHCGATPGTQRLCWRRIESDARQPFGDGQNCARLGRDLPQLYVAPRHSGHTRPALIHDCLDAPTRFWYVKRLLFFV